ncbi:MAG: pirin family protein [Acidobacteriota bacterium]|nr:pirin family protein [Acidobacteriota bacterium]
MIRVRRSEERGHANHGWLDSYHTFSFADYHDPEFMGFRSLRVINEDRVAAGQGFGMHGHRDMEILTYVTQGSLAHKDSMGHEQVLGPNEVQRMSAGTGIRHSEFNPSRTEPVHLFQIWIEPASLSTKPGYEQLRFDPEQKKNRLMKLAGPQGDNSNGVAINQNARMYVAELAKGAEIPYSLNPNHAAWVQVIQGEVALNGTGLQTGDAAAVTAEESLAFTGLGAGTNELLLFDLA